MQDGLTLIFINTGSKTVHCRSNQSTVSHRSPEQLGWDKKTPAPAMRAICRRSTRFKLPLNVCLSLASDCSNEILRATSWDCVAPDERSSRFGRCHERTLRFDWLSPKCHCWSSAKAELPWPRSGLRHWRGVEISLHSHGRKGRTKSIAHPTKY
jgi:hypothetical protein